MIIFPEVCEETDCYTFHVMDTCRHLYAHAYTDTQTLCTQIKQERKKMTQRF